MGTAGRSVEEEDLPASDAELFVVVETGPQKQLLQKLSGVLFVVWESQSIQIEIICDNNN